MKYLDVRGKIEAGKWYDGGENEDTRKFKNRSIAKKSEEFNKQLKKKEYFFVCDLIDDELYAGIITNNSEKIEDKIEDYFKTLNIAVVDISIEEVIYRQIKDLIWISEKNKYVDRDILKKLGLGSLEEDFCTTASFKEEIIKDYKKKEIYNTAKNLLSDKTLVTEIDRIFECKGKRGIKGHPVHYMIQTDNGDICEEMNNILLQALYVNDRVENRRYSIIGISPNSGMSDVLYDWTTQKMCEALYRSSAGGTVVINYSGRNSGKDEYASSEEGVIRYFSALSRRFSQRVLTIFCLPRECSKIKSIIFENCKSMCFVEIMEELTSGDKAKEYLRNLARRNKIRTDKKLFSYIDENKSYLTPELSSIYHEWYVNKLRTNIYPQYKDLMTARHKVIEAPPKGSAYDELMNMVGLNSAKEIINQAVNFTKAQKVFANKGINMDRPAMHMVFYGNPGTAKTTVARLVAKIMRENGVLSKGNLFEMGRSDLVGQYVGWTAPNISRKFKEAAGSVLFIDEAYSLLDDRKGLFGDEAINTIVQEMENHREDVIVIFAGYPDEMEEFIQRNPGLRSRITYHVPFEDYTADELWEITQFIASKKEMNLSEEIKEKLMPIFEAEKNEKDFGNGRFVRNIIEKAMMKQATRLLELDPDSITTKDVTMLCAEDIEVPKITKQVKAEIGFAKERN